MANLTNEIDAFILQHKISATRFGRLALNDAPFVTQIKNGRRVWPETEAKVRTFMAEYPPAQAAA